MNTNFYLVRHAHSIYTPEELTRPLSESGVKAARKIADLLEEENINYVISSPYKRAVQTVEGIANKIGEVILLDERFRERKVSDNPVEDFQSAIIKLWDNPHFFFEGGESNKVSQARGVCGIKDLLRNYEGKNIVVGTHGNIMALILNYFDNRYDYNFWKKLSMPDIYKLSFDGGILVETIRIWKD